MTTATLAVRPRRRSIARAWATDAHLAGLSLFSGGVILLMGIITAEALYPMEYSTFGNEISDLGGTRPPEGLVFQPSATIFNTTMLVAGILAVFAAVAVHRAFAKWHVSVPIAILGVGAALVAIFPGNTGTPHAISAMVAFFAGGVAAVLSSSVTRPPFRWALTALGVVTLAALGSYFVLGEANPLWALGVGGAERWVAYPEILWMLGFGGYLAGAADADDRGSAPANHSRD